MNVEISSGNEGKQPGQRELYDRQREVSGDFEVVERSCPLCGTNNDDRPPSRYSLGFWTVKQCGNCAFVYIDKAPVYAALSEQMAWENSARIEQEWRETSRPVQQQFSKRTRWRLRLFPRTDMARLVAEHAQPGNVLDLGCGDGAQLAKLDPSFVPFGIEVSAQGAAAADRVCRARGGQVVHGPCLEGLRLFRSDYFSAAILRSYLEHELNPKDVLLALHRALAAGGLAFVKVPNFASLNRVVMGRRWTGFRHPDHLNYFTPATLRLMARRCGFQVRMPWSWRLPTSDNMYAILLKAN